MKKYFMVILIFCFHYSYSQFNTGMNLDDAKKEIKTYRENITITQEYFSEINSIVLRYTYMDSQIVCYFKNNICYQQIIIPSKISAYNEWISMFNEVLIKNEDNKWVSFNGGKTTRFEVEYWEKNDINIIRIFEED